MKFRIFCPGLCLVAALCVLQCGGEWSAGEDSRAVSCDLGEWYGGTPRKLAVSGDETALYVLDSYGSVYGYARNEARVCAYESDPGFGSFGSLSLNFADDIALAGSYLYYDDGIEVLRYDDEDWSCDVTPLSMSVQAGSMVAGGTAGLEDYSFTSAGCTERSTSFSGVLRVQAVAADNSIVAAVEAVTGSGSPERLSIYDRSSGSALYRTALSSLEDSELHFCAATRLRLGSSFILLLDADCGTLGVFNYDGTLAHRLDLSELGIRSPEDMAVVGDDLYILNGSTVRTLFRLDFATYSWESASL